MVRIRAKYTIVGDYGKAHAGEEIDVQKSVADSLIKRNLAEIVEEDKAKEKAPHPHTPKNKEGGTKPKA